MLKKDLKRKLNAFDRLYWGCVRPLYIEMLSSFCKEVFMSKKEHIILCEFKKQFKKIQKNKPFSLSRITKKYLEEYTIKFIKKNIRKYSKLGYYIAFKGNKFFFNYNGQSDCFLILSTKSLNTIGLTELYEGNDSCNTHLITLTSPLSELYFDLMSLINKPLLYVFKDVIYQFDSIYLHERQHAHDDIQTLVSNKTRANDAYYRHLKSSSTYHFNRYVEHPAEILANVQQIVYYLHQIKPCGSIDATRIIKFFMRYKEYKHACSFRRVELNKFYVLFAPGKRHDKKWYRLMLRLINFKFYVLYRRNIIRNINMCLDNLTIK